MRSAFFGPDQYVYSGTFSTALTSALRRRPARILHGTTLVAGRLQRAVRPLIAPSFILIIPRQFGQALQIGHIARVIVWRLRFQDTKNFAY